jgi:holliday junction DNA helicase ruvA
MISFVKGFIVDISENFVIIDNNGIGYGINVSTTTLGKLSLNTEAKLFTYMVVREDDLSLYGFTSKEELKMFNQLLTVSGVGPKGALSLLSSLTPSQLALAIITEDIKSLSSGQGIGKKTAQRIALELKDKISNEQAVENGSVLNSIVSDNSAKSDAIEGLLALGFTKNEVTQAINAIYTADLTSSQLISKALKVLN